MVEVCFQYYSTNAVYSPSSTCCCYQKDKRAKPGNLPKNNVSISNVIACVGMLRNWQRLEGAQNMLCYTKLFSIV